MLKNLCAAAMLAICSMNANADEVSIEAVLSPVESMKMEFADGSKHFVLMVRREGVAEGGGVFDGATVTEHGWHDIHPPFGGDPIGYLELKTGNGDVAYLKWAVRAVFIKGQDKPALFDNGYRELVSGTGRFAAKRGVGSLVIKPAGGPKRRYILQGNIGDKP